MKSSPKMVEYQCGSSDMIQSTDGEGGRQRVGQQSRAPTTARTRRVSPGTTPPSFRSCAAEYLFNMNVQNIQTAKYTTARPMKNRTFR